MTEKNMDKRLHELEYLAKGIESNVYTSCVINIFPQDFDNLYWAIKTIKDQQELIEAYGRVAEGMTEDYQKLNEKFNGIRKDF